MARPVHDLISIDIILPVYNEEAGLPGSVQTLYSFLTEHMSSYQWRIVVADNGSVDSTLDVARGLSNQYERVGHAHLDQKGRGRALHKTWAESDADVICYMDLDLSTRLESLPPLVKAIEDGYDVAVGSRLIRGAKVEKRSLKREVISRCYNLLIKLMFRTRFSDAQCGFKAVSQKVSREVIPLIKDRAWFFDSELLIIAEKNGYRIKDVPVHWVDDPDTRVKVVGTAWRDFKGLLRLRFGGIPRPARSANPKAHDNST